MIFAIEDNSRGKVTIDTLGLNRDELVDMRKEYYEARKVIYELATLEPPIPESKKAKELMNRYIQSSSQYALMIRCALKSNFKSVS
ncbi:MAG: hypothetical protein JW787_10490 [Sedimentisphaerales bacterium]|nr:hypothetical protein [Sedimentisphaerales bacterium]